MDGSYNARRDSASMFVGAVGLLGNAERRRHFPRLFFPEAIRLDLEQPPGQRAEVRFRETCSKKSLIREKTIDKLP